MDDKDKFRKVARAFGGGNNEEREEDMAEFALRNAIRKAGITSGFLENNQLYSKTSFDGTCPISELHLNTFKRFCESCESEQTFIDPKFHCGPFLGTGDPIAFNLMSVFYRCARCNDGQAGFLLWFTEHHVTKVGEFPKIDVSLPPVVKKWRESDRGLFYKGLICESHGYGIGAFCYYRRILEGKMDDILEKIPEAYDEQDDEKRKNYIEQLENVKKCKQAVEKIKYVKPYLPESMHIEGMNPLKELYDILSEGVHRYPDEECLKIATGVKSLFLDLYDDIIIRCEKKKKRASNLKDLKSIRGSQG